VNHPPRSNDLPPLPAIPRGRYRHYKGGEYEVLGTARHSETLEPMTIYRALDGSGLWVRPAAMFVETIDWKGLPQARFAKIDCAPPAGADPDADRQDLDSRLRHDTR